MISSLKTALPRLHENLSYLVLTGVVETADGQLASFTIPNNSFDIVAIFERSSPRSTTAHLRIRDGLSNSVLDLPAASIQIEQGAPEPSWPGLTLGLVRITGTATDGRIWMGQSSGVLEADPTSLIFEFAVSNGQTPLKQRLELSKHFDAA